MPKILIVEDEANCRELLEMTLRSEGFEVKSASGGDQAIDLGRAFKPDLLISDWRLRDTKDGIDVAKVLQGEQPSLKVILFSGSPSDELLAEANSVALEVFKALEKPLGLDDVVEAVNSAMN